MLPFRFAYFDTNYDKTEKQDNVAWDRLIEHDIRIDLLMEMNVIF